jgi:hypothetical protein
MLLVGKLIRMNRINQIRGGKGMKEYKTTQFTPECKTVLNYGKWSVFQAIKSFPGGPAIAIDGKCYAFPPCTAWEHTPGVPWFETEREAAEVAIELRKLDAWDMQCGPTNEDMHNMELQTRNYGK